MLFAHQLYEQLCQLGLADTREAFQPTQFGTIGINSKVGQLAIFTVSNPLRSIRRELDGLNDRRLVIFRLVNSR